MKRLFTIGFLLLIISFSACKKKEPTTPVGEEPTPIAKNLLSDIEVNDQGFEIVELPADIEGGLDKYFSHYARIKTDDGKGFHILLEADVDTEFVLKVKQIFEMLLEEKPESNFGQRKYVIAQKLSEHNCCFCIFKNEESYEANIEDVINSGMKIGSCVESQSYLNGSSTFLSHTRHDKAYSGVLDFIVRYGIRSSMPTYYEKIAQAAMHAVTKRFYMPHQELDIEDRTVEYFSILVDVFYGNWNYNDFDEHYEKYSFASRLDMMDASYGDTEGADLMDDFFNDTTHILNRINPAFSGVLYMGDSTSYPYTNKTRFWSCVELTGSKSANIYGNIANNILIGNSGANVFQSDKGDDRIDGKAGDDSAIYPYLISSGTYQIYTDSVIVDHNYYGRDVLYNIEHLVFKDETIDID